MRRCARTRTALTFGFASTPLCGSIPSKSNRGRAFRGAGRRWCPAAPPRAVDERTACQGDGAVRFSAPHAPLSRPDPPLATRARPAAGRARRVPRAGDRVPSRRRRRQQRSADVPQH
eukprot:4296777-Prymnesium_polylepis.1